jgi:C-terminal processing protease CtpA/Prc
LVNRQSYSQSTVTAAQIQDYGFGQVVGEETAEHPNLFASIFTYELPKTGIRVDVPKGKIQRVNGVDDNKGVIPDILIADHLLDEEDEILEGLLKQLENAH